MHKLQHPDHQMLGKRAQRLTAWLQIPCFVRQRRLPRQHVCRTFAKTDYAATASDANVLQQPLKQELTSAEVKHVFGYSSALKEK